MHLKNILIFYMHLLSINNTFSRIYSYPNLFLYQLQSLANNLTTLIDSSRLNSKSGLHYKNFRLFF
jgi:hypothetical protein